MRRFVWTAALGLLLASPCLGVWGATDQTPGASVLVPFFEVGIDVATAPQDTNLFIYNRGAAGTVTVHWEVYTIDGDRVFWGNQAISGAATWAISMRNHLNTFASLVERNMLIDGDFWRGFMTVDVVTESTNLSPFDAMYPFGTANTLLGYAYYARLLQGSANGLAMIPLEYTASSGVDAFLNGFYGTDDLEEIDINARLCSTDLVQGGTCAGLSDDDVTIRARVFQSTPLNGSTRIIVFAWNTADPDGGGPSAICGELGTCDETYSYNRFRENSGLADSGTLRLDHVVNIIDTSPGDVAPGEFILIDVPDPSNSTQLFAFSFNSASPAGNPNVNWDAILEASILP